MHRRLMLHSALALLAATGMRSVAGATPGIPFETCNVRVVRRRGWEELMGRNKCVISDLYKTVDGFPVSDLGVKVCTVLELPWRANMNDISAIPAGGYNGFVRTDGPLGWRIELTGTGPRQNVEVHVGNSPVNTKGCLLPGTGDSTDKSCFVTGSKDAMSLLRARVGSDDRRPVALLVQQG